MAEREITYPLRQVVKYATMQLVVEVLPTYPTSDAIHLH